MTIFSKKKMQYQQLLNKHKIVQQKLNDESSEVKNYKRCLSATEDENEALMLTNDTLRRKHHAIETRLVDQNRILQKKYNAMQRVQDLEDDIRSDTPNLEEVRDKIKKLECPICMTNQRDYVLSCGHAFCKTCVHQTKTCGVCRQRILSRKPLYLT